MTFALRGAGKPGADRRLRDKIPGRKTTLLERELPHSAATICFAGTHDPRFTRSAILAEGLRQHGCAITYCVDPAWGSTDARVTAAQRGLRNPELLFRLARAYLRVLRLHHAQRSRPDALILGHPGQLDAIVLRALAPRIPIVLDAFIAIDETLADRGLTSPGSPTRRLARLLDRLAIRAADLIIVDTAAHARRYATEYGLDLARAVIVPVGALDPGARPHPNPLPEGEGAELSPLRVLYFGGFIPLHGVPVILEAASRLSPEEGIEIELVGEGQQAAEAEAFLGRTRLPHVRLQRGWMPETELVERHIAQADVSLGIFALAQKTMDVVPAKLYLALACGRAVVTADTPAVREELVARAADDEPPLVLCTPGDAGSLVDALRRLRDDTELRTRVAAAGRRLYEAHFRPEQVVGPLVAAIEGLRG